MKFLEVKLCYMNTNLVQENFSRYPAAPDLPSAAMSPRLTSQWHVGIPFGWDSLW
jgi:hypothetical protein